MEQHELLSGVCDDIELLTGIKTVIYDENQKIIHSQPDMMCDFCKEIRCHRQLTEKCLACDACGFERSAQAQDIFIYHCHMGLTEAVAPVTENGRTVGYLMLGQILATGGRARVGACIDALADSALRERLYAHLDAMTESDEKHLRATARILAMSAAYVRSRELLSQRKSATGYKIEQYVFENLQNPSLSAGTLCAALGFSRTALYNASVASFGMGAAEYVRKVRAERALHLLRTTSLSAAQVAERVGVSTTARLNRLLKAQTGQTAGEIRRQKKG
ncbi:MAG: PocR ligand-binding domain-containing protein [Clostridia bacterium]|nr:PocR ligand-binding domain-containing protein [Clostridia bacterium]